MQTPEEKVEELRGLVMFLMKQIRDVTARAEALRCLLEAHGVFSQEEYERVHAEALTEWTRAFGAAMTEKMAAAKNEELLKQLRTLAGNLQ